MIKCYDLNKYTYVYTHVQVHKHMGGYKANINSRSVEF